MKKAVTIVCAVFFLFILSFGANASEVYPEEYYAEVWDSVDGETKKLMNDIGVDASFESFDEMTPEKIFSVLISLFSSSVKDACAGFCTILGIMLAVNLVLSADFSSETVKNGVQCVGCACIMFAVISVTYEVISDVSVAVGLTEDFMLGVIPVLAGVIAMSGSPSLALSFNTVVLTFAQFISGIYSSVLPGYASVCFSFSAAGVLNPFFSCEKLTSILNKLGVSVMGFISGVFVAVMSIRGVIAGAADTVTIKGLRFLIGRSVPVVGSAIGDALNSVVASLGLIRHSLAAFALLAAVLTVLPSLVKLIVYKFLLNFLGVFADILSLKKIADFVNSANGILSFFMAVLCFNLFVFVISIAIVLTVKSSV